MRHFASTSLAPTALFLIALTVARTQPTQAQTYKVIYNFTAGTGGCCPYAGVTMDRAGRLYGAADAGGGDNAGTVFRLTQKGSGWVFSPLYSFQGGPNDGIGPNARVIFGPNGGLFGTTVVGGLGCNGEGCGTVFMLTPYPTACKTALCAWEETVLHRFTAGSDGAFPYFGDVVLDQAGSLYGTTAYGGGGSGCGGNNGCGTVYKLTPSNGGWTESVLYSFQGGSDGAFPYAGVIFDQAGNLYGTTAYGGGSGCAGNGCGTVFQLTSSGSGWVENTLYSFQGGNDGASPFGGLIFDQSGNLYGSTAYTSSFGVGGGTVFELSPSGSNWIHTVLYSFSGGAGPYDTLTIDAGNLYGTTNRDGAYGYGSVFKLTHSGGGWTYTSLHDFTAGSDGGYVYGGVILDSSGNLYGTTQYGGSGGDTGVVWEITP